LFASTYNIAKLLHLSLIFVSPNLISASFELFSKEIHFLQNVLQGEGEKFESR